MNQILRQWFILFIFSFLSQTTWAQEQLNSYDSQGKKHGLWKEYYDPKSSHLKYEGHFEHGERVGMFKFYKEGSKHPAAIMDFDPASNEVQAKYLTQRGKTISEGKMLNQQRTGLWIYYHKNSDKVMMTENYKEGKLHGEKKIYYDNGALAEEATYVNGELHGPRKLYSVKNVVLEDLNYDNGELHGPAKFYNGKGELMSEGHYINNKHHGTWRYYENGELNEEKDF